MPDELLADPTYVSAGVPSEGKNAFDADFCGYASRDAEQIDPHDRMAKPVVIRRAQAVGVVPTLNFDKPKLRIDFEGAAVALRGQTARHANMWFDARTHEKNGALHTLLIGVRRRRMKEIFHN